MNSKNKYAPPKWLIDAKYGDPATSGLTLNVLETPPEGGYNSRWSVVVSGEWYSFCRLRLNLFPTTHHSPLTTHHSRLAIDTSWRPTRIHISS